MISYRRHFGRSERLSQVDVQLGGRVCQTRIGNKLPAENEPKTIVQLGR